MRLVSAVLVAVLLTIEPDVPVMVEADDYFAGRDPTLEAALGVLP